MAALLETQSGDGPIDGLIAAAQELADAVAGYRRSPITPPGLIDTTDRLSRVITAA